MNSKVVPMKTSNLTELYTRGFEFFKKEIFQGYPACYLFPVKVELSVFP